MLSCLCSVIQNGNDKVEQTGAKGRVKGESGLGPRGAPERNSFAISKGPMVPMVQTIKEIRMTGPKRQKPNLSWGIFVGSAGLNKTNEVRRLLRAIPR